MAKVQRTVTICDRCGVEHRGTPEGFTFGVTTTVVKAFNVSTVTGIDWRDLCSACSIQVEETIKGLIIG